MTMMKDITYNLDVRVKGEGDGGGRRGRSPQELSLLNQWKFPPSDNYLPDSTNFVVFNSCNNVKHDHYWKC